MPGESAKSIFVGESKDLAERRLEQLVAEGRARDALSVDSEDGRWLIRLREN
jgi:hypothetical protein